MALFNGTLSFWSHLAYHKIKKKRQGGSLGSLSTGSYLSFINVHFLHNTWWLSVVTEICIAAHLLFVQQCLTRSEVNCTNVELRNAGPIKTPAAGLLASQIYSLWTVAKRRGDASCWDNVALHQLFQMCCSHQTQNYLTCFFLWCYKSI